MGKDKFEFARIASPEEIAEYLTSLAAGLKRGDVSLESRQRTLHLNPVSDLKIELTVKDRDDKGKDHDGDRLEATERHDGGGSPSANRIPPRDRLGTIRPCVARRLTA